MPVRAVTC